MDLPAHGQYAECIPETDNFLSDLYKNQGVSVILVAGSSGAYFHIADKVIQMDTYRTLDITEKVRAICERTPEKEGDVHELALSMLGNNLWKQNDRVLTAYKVEKKHDQIKAKQFGKDSFSIGKSAVELKYVEQISDVEQTTTLSYVMKYWNNWKRTRTQRFTNCWKPYVTGSMRRDLEQCVAEMCREIWQKCADRKSMPV